MTADVRLHGDDTGCTSCGHPEGCPCTCCTPGYQPTRIATCPDCMSDLTNEAWDFWCTACRKTWGFNEVAYFEEGQPDD